MLGLHEVGELAVSGQWDHVVVDCASTADALRMLTLPATFGLYLERAWPRHRRLSTGTDDARAAAVVELVERIGAGTEQLGSLLTDGERVSAHLVMTPERVVAAEAVRTLGSLALMGVQVDELIVNQILVQDDSYEYRNLPEHPAFDWYSERISEQQAVLDELDTTIGDVQLVLVPHLAGEPIGAKALGELLDSARRRDGSPPPGPLRPIVDRESGSGLEAVYRLRLELPQVDSAALTLGRVDDDLIIGAGGMRRRVRLASVLRRCIVVDAQLRGSELTVRFPTESGGVASMTGAPSTAGGDIGPELRQLAQTILDRLDPAVRLAAARAAGSGAGPGKCQQVWCPVCALAALVAGEQHPLLTVIAEHSVALLAVIRAIVEDTADQPGTRPDRASRRPMGRRRRTVPPVVNRRRPGPGAISTSR